MTDIKSMFKNALILFVITLVAGVSLGFVYQVTKDPIAYQEELAQIIAKVLSSALTKITLMPYSGCLRIQLCTVRLATSVASRRG